MQVRQPSQDHAAGHRHYRLVILLANVGVWSWYTANIIWPIVVIIAACAKMGCHKGCKCENK